ncbi:MAG: plasmid recombination protein [Clostridia bacterium]
MSDLAYTIHLGNDKNKTKKGKISTNKTLSNNAIQNSSQLSKVNNHNLRKYDNDMKNNKIIFGTNDLVSDVKKLYVQEFEEAKINYNNMQTRNDRKIENYFKYVSDNTNRDLACELIIELGDKDFWQDKTDEYKYMMESVYKKQIEDLNNILPKFKIANATIHFDESSPHLHVIGVPVKTGYKNGMKKQVAKSQIFTKDSLKNLQDKMRKHCIDSFNKIYDKGYNLKEKDTGRNYDFSVSKMKNYSILKKDIQTKRLKLEKVNNKTKSLSEKTLNIENIIKELKPTKLNKNNYVVTNETLQILNDYTTEVKSTTSSIKSVDKLNMVINDCEKDLRENNLLFSQLYYESEQKDIKIKGLTRELNDSRTIIDKLKNKINVLQEQVYKFKTFFDKVMKFFQNKVFNKNDNVYEKIVDELYTNNVLTEKIILKLVKNLI